MHDIVNGLYPYDEPAIFISAFAPSERTERPEIQPEPDHIHFIDLEYSNEDNLPLAVLQQSQ